MMVSIPVHFRGLCAVLAVAALGVVLAGCSQDSADRAGQGLEAVAVQLADGGRALLPVVVPEDASAKEKKMAQAVAYHLGRITGGDFDVRTGTGRRGVVVHVHRASDYLPPGVVLDEEDPRRRDEYWIGTHGEGVWIIGATESGLEYAVWDFLHRLGYRQFFPGETWEVVPSDPELRVNVQAHGRPDYFSRNLWYSGGEFGGGNSMTDPAVRQWFARNRIHTMMMMPTYHMYRKRLFKAYAKTFKEHPEYLALSGGKRVSMDAGDAKLCISNPALRRLVAQFVMQYFEENPQAASISLESTDGGLWCQCNGCRALGSVSDQAVVLANEAAAALAASDFPRRTVNMLSYNEHTVPPKIHVQPNVAVGITTSYRFREPKSTTLDQIIDGWKRQGVRVLGIYEYLSAFSYHGDMPRRARAGSVDYLRSSIPRFHAKGARFYHGETTNAWGPNGLGHYLTARMLWDVGEAERVGDLIDDFLTKCFGPAREPMRRFYNLIQSDEAEVTARALAPTDPARHHLDARIVRQMYRALAAARALVGGAKSRARRAAIRGRINDLILYTRYVALYRRLENAKGPARQELYEKILRFVYRIRQTRMVNGRWLFREAPGKGIKVIAEKDIPAGWKADKPHTDAEISDLLSEALERPHATAPQRLAQPPAAASRPTTRPR